ncbi:MAG: MFS transporter [Rhodothermales bacterium]|nr:MFS transporter [Rhodothermales bacterium]
MSDRKSNPQLIILALWLMMFSASAQVIIVSPILPEISRALSIRSSLQGTLITSYTIMLGIMALVIGPVSDKVGRRRILLLGCSSLAVTLYLHGVANSFLSLLTMRALAGAAAGMLSGAAVAYVGDYFPYERRGWANGWVVSGVAVGQILGIPAGKILANQLGYKWPFLMFAITMTVAALLVWFFVPQPDVERETSRLTLKSVVSRYGKLIIKPEVFAASMVYFLMFLSLGMYVIYFPTWLENVVGLTAAQVALLFIIGGVANVVSSPVAGRLSDQVGRKPLIIISCLGLSLIMVLTTIVVTNYWYAYIMFALAMVMFALRYSPLQSLMTALVTSEKRGMFMSLAIAIGQVGMGFGSAIAGIAYTEYGYASNTFLGAFVIFVMAFIVLRYLPEPERISTTVTETYHNVATDPAET